MTRINLSFKLFSRNEVTVEVEYAVSIAEFLTKLEINRYNPWTPFENIYIYFKEKKRSIDIFFFFFGL